MALRGQQWQPRTRQFAAPLRPGAVIAGAAFSAAVAGWLVPASIHVVEWPADGDAQRIAVFAPAMALAAWLTGGAALALTVWFAGRPDNAARGRRAYVIAPLFLLALWMIPFVPLLAAVRPPLLILAGPVRWLILAAAIAWAVQRVRRIHGSRLSGIQLPGPRVVLAVSFLLYAGLGLRSAATIGLTGDEPQYLIITQSLLADGDLRIENNHRNGEYRSFYRLELPPDFMRRGQDGHIYSIHAPGLAALLLPVYAIAGYWGAVVAMCLLAALAALGVFRAAEVIGGRRVAWATWLAVCATVPFLPYAWSIFPEMAATAIAAWGVVWLLSPPPDSMLAWLLRGGALALLPWLHTKFVILLAGFAIVLVVPRVKHALAFGAPIAVSLIAWFGFFYIVYGTPNPEAPYGDYARQWVRFENVPRGVLGLLLDQKFGLLIYAPVYLLAGRGLWIALRHDRWRLPMIACAAMAAVFVISSARLYMWWGGWSAPARFLVPVLPLAAPALAIFLSTPRRKRRTAEPRNSEIPQRPNAGPLTVLLYGLSVAVAAAGTISPEAQLLFSDAHGTSRLAEQVQGSAPLTSLLPTFTEQEWPYPQLETMRRDVMTRGRTGLLDTFDPERLRAFDYTRFRKLMPDEWLAAGSLQLPPALSPAPAGHTHITPPLTLPPGQYTLDVAYAPGALHGELSVFLGASRFARMEAPLRNPSRLAFEVPAATTLTARVSHASTAKLVREIFVTARSIVPPRDRAPFTPLAIERVADRERAYLAYVDDRVYPEGGVFWTKDRDRTQVWVYTGEATQLELLLRVGAPATVDVEVDGRPVALTLTPGETRVLPIDQVASGTWIPVTVRASASFRPIDVEPGSTDARVLGCQVRVQFK